jgi:hypothetical protein
MLSPNGINSIYAAFSAPKSATYLEIGIFDGDSGKNSSGIIDITNGNWDDSSTELIYELYADPKGDGSGTQLVHTWHGNIDPMPNNDWFNINTQLSDVAKSPSGNYYYFMKIYFNGANTAWPAFKLRSNYHLSILPKGGLPVGGQFATMRDIPILYPDFVSWSNMGSSTYDGNISFFFDVSESKNIINIWDGDTDAYDTDDPDTPNDVIPEWASTPITYEGAKGTGAPKDDSASSIQRRSPNVYLMLKTSDGEIFNNSDPSGNSEWEKFTISTDTFDRSQMDYHAEVLPPGIYEYKYTGLDMHNFSNLKFDFPVLGVDAAGLPVPPLKPYLIGGTIWSDANKNKVQDSGELGISGVTVNVYDDSGYLLKTLSTDSNGKYSYEVDKKYTDPYTNRVINSGIYQIKIAPENFNSPNSLYGYTLTSTTSDLTGTILDDNDIDLNIGYYKPAPVTPTPTKRATQTVPFPTTTIEPTLSTTPILTPTLTITPIITKLPLTGDTTVVKVVDKDMKPIVNTEITIDSKKYKTDTDGKILLDGLTAGQHEVSLIKGDKTFKNTFLSSAENQKQQITVILNDSNNWNSNIWYLICPMGSIILILLVLIYYRKKKKLDVGNW